MIGYAPFLGQGLRDPWKEEFENLKVEIYNLLPYLSDVNRAVYASRLRQCESKAEPWEAVRCALDVEREIRDLVGENPTKRTEGIPGWAWVIGGLAAAGLVVYVATK